MDRKAGAWRSALAHTQGNFGVDKGGSLDAKEGKQMIG